MDLVRQNDRFRPNMVEQFVTTCPSCVCPAVGASRIGRPCTARRLREFWPTARIEAGRDNDLDAPFCRRGLLVATNGGASDHLDIAVVGGGDRVHQPIPNPRFQPSHETGVTDNGAREGRDMAQPIAAA